MATSEKVGIFTHVDDNGNTTLLYPVTKMEAVDGLPEETTKLKQDIEKKVQKSNVVNNFTTTEEGFVADARALMKLAEMSQSSINFYQNCVQTVWNNNIIKRNGICSLSAFIGLSPTAKFNLYVDNNIGTIPEGFRPVSNQYVAVQWRSGKYVQIILYPNGAVSICPYDNIDGADFMSAACSVSYVCQEVY